MKIAIIGAGFTGLVAAYRLASAGHEITIYEKSSEVGGLAAGFEICGNYLEKAYHHIFKTDTDIINLAEDLGLSDKLLWLKSSMGIYYNGKIYAYGTPKSLLFFRPLSIMSRVRQAFVLLYLAKSHNWQKFINVSAYEWLKKYTGKQNMKVIFTPLLTGKFHQYYDKVSMAWMWARVHTRGNSQEKGGEKLGYFDGGFRIIINALQKELEKNKVKILLNQNISSITNYELRVDNNTEDKEHIQLQIFIADKVKSELYDKILVTIPSSVFANLIDSKEIDKNYVQKLRSINYLGAVVMVFASTQKLSDYYWNNINDITMPFLVFINHTNLVSPEKYNNKYIYYVAGYYPHDHKYFQISNEEIESEWLDSVKKIFPEFIENEITEKHLFRFKNAQHVVDFDYDKKIPDYQTPIKNVYLANFSQIFPHDRGTNFAVREGNNIAKVILES